MNNNYKNMALVALFVVCGISAYLIGANTSQSTQNEGVVCFEWTNGNTTMNMVRSEMFDIFYQMGVFEAQSGPTWRYNENNSECLKWLRLEE